jgi:hypothetical protein
MHPAKALPGAAWWLGTVDAHLASDLYGYHDDGEPIIHMYFC